VTHITTHRDKTGTCVHEHTQRNTHTHKHVSARGRRWPCSSCSSMTSNQMNIPVQHRPPVLSGSRGTESGGQGLRSGEGEHKVRSVEWRVWSRACGHGGKFELTHTPHNHTRHTHPHT